MLHRSILSRLRLPTITRSLVASKSKNLSTHIPSPDEEPKDEKNEQEKPRRSWTPWLVGATIVTAVGQAVYEEVYPKSIWSHYVEIDPNNYTDLRHVPTKDLERILKEKYQNEKDASNTSNSEATVGLQVLPKAAAQEKATEPEPQASAASGSSALTLDEAFSLINELQKQLANTDAAKQAAADEAVKAAEEHWKSQVEELVKQWVDAYERMKRQMEEEAVSIIDSVHESMSSRLATALAEQAEQLHKEAQYHLNAQKKSIEDSYAEQVQERRTVLAELMAKAAAFQRIFSEQSEYERVSHKAQQMMLCALSMKHILERTEPFDRAWARLRQVARDDPLLTCALNAVPDRVVFEGVSTTEALQQRYQYVEKAAKVAAFVPPQSSIWAQILAQVFGAMSLREHALVNGNDDHAKLSRAGYYLDKGNIASCVNELESLSTNPRDICSDWLDLAKSRLALEASLEVITARAGVIAVSFS